MTYAESWQGFLKTLFDLAKGRPGVDVETANVFALMEARCLPVDDVDTRQSVLAYLADKQFIKTGMGFVRVSITTQGIDALQVSSLI
jgi:hypothetical protein